MDLLELRHSSNNKKFVRHPWEKARLLITIRFITKYCTPKAGLSVLDVGCGDGFLLEGLQDHFKQGLFMGVDNAFDDSYIAGKNAGASGKNIVFFKYLEDVPDHLLTAGVSVVLVMDVLEHIKDDEEFLLKLSKARFVAKSTMLYITVPSFQYLFSSHDIFLKHYRRYTNRELINVVQRSGFRIVNAGYFFTSLLPLRLVFTVTRKILKTPAAITSGLVWNKGKFLSAVTSNFLVLDFKVCQVFNALGIKLPGLSNYAVCRKSA